MAGLETATIELLSLDAALHAGDTLAWAAVGHAVEAAEGLGPHPFLGDCAGCGARWTRELGPLCLVEAYIDQERVVGLVCEDCAGRGPDAVAAMLDRILRSMLPQGAQVVEQRVLWSQQAGHA